MAGIFGENINCRKDFFSALQRAKAATDKLVQKMPSERTLKAVQRQLEAIQEWTADERQPTLEERKRIVMGLQMFREYETSGDEDIQQLTSSVGELNNYFLYWPSDEDAKNPKNDELFSLVDILYEDD